MNSKNKTKNPASCCTDFSCRLHPFSPLKSDQKMKITNNLRYRKIFTLFSALVLIFGASATGNTGTFEEWIDQFDLDENEQDPKRNPSGDGISNLLKYALNLDPNIAARKALPKPEIIDDRLRLTIDKNPDAADLKYHLEGSSDLENWSRDDISISEEKDAIIATDEAAEPNDSRFLRLRVSMSGDNDNNDEGCEDCYIHLFDGDDFTD